MGDPFEPLLLPVIYAQGRRVRGTVPRLPEPAGPREGRVDADAGASADAPPLRLLVVGDSAAAGVGAASQDEALAGRLVRDLARDGAVAWRLEARTGATAAGTLRHFETLDAGPFDVAVTSLGLNDVTRGNPTAAVAAEIAALVELLRERWGVRHVVLSGLPPIGEFPALPQPLRGYLGRRARELDVALRRWAAARDGVEHLPLDFTDDPSTMATDGFHPGPAAYALWARAVAARIRARRAGDAARR